MHASVHIEFCIYIKSGSTCTEAAIWRRHVSTVAQRVGLLRV